jgi:hypothetical protein
MSIEQPNVESGEPQTVTQRRSTVPILLLALAVAACGAYGYWKLIFYPTTPQYAIDRFIEAARAKDYDRVYNMVQVPPPVKALVRNGSDLRKMAEKSRGLLPEIKEYHFGTSTIAGDQATVETTVIGTQAGGESTSVVPFKLVKTNGVWLIDGKWILAEALKRGFGGVFMNGAE